MASLKQANIHMHVRNAVPQAWPNYKYKATLFMNNFSILAIICAFYMYSHKRAVSSSTWSSYLQRSKGSAKGTLTF